MNRRGFQHRSLLTTALATAFLAACSAGPTDSDPSSAPISDPTRQAMWSPPLQTTTPLPVSIDWAPELGRHLAVAHDGFRATVTNNTREGLEVDVIAVGIHEQTPAVTLVAELALAAGERADAFLALDHIPLQTSNAAVPIKLMAVIHGAHGKPMQVPSKDLAVAFDPTYRTAFASTRDPFGPNVAAARGGDPVEPHIAALLAEPADSVLSLAQMNDALGATPTTLDHVEGRMRAKDETWKPLAVGSAHADSIDAIAEGATHLGAPMPTFNRGGAPKTDIVLYPPTKRMFFGAHVCARYSSYFTDTHIGEDYLNDGMWVPYGKWGLFWLQSPARARYSQYWIYDKATNQQISSGFLDQDGCTTLTLFAGGTFTMDVQTKMKRDTTTYDVLHVSPKGIDYTCTDSTLLQRNNGRECADNAFFARDFTITAPASFLTTVEATVDSSYDNESFRVAAVAGQIMMTPDNGLLPNSVYPVYSNTGCPWLTQDNVDYHWVEACASNDSRYNSAPGWAAFFGLGMDASHRDTTLEKFVIAHEMGHQLQGAQGTMNANTSYADDGTSPPPLCRCDHVTSANHIHCLQSRHSWGTAETEGWAHFISTRTFNRTDESDCVFGYYKEVLRDGGQIDRPPVRIDCTAKTRWTPNHCPLSGYSSEWDILGFLHEIDRDGSDGLSMDDIFGIYKKMTWRNWAGLQAGALAYFGNDTNNPKYKRVMAAASAYGVNL